MAVLVDANVILDVLEDDLKWANWSIDMLERCGGQGPLAINAIIYAEVSTRRPHRCPTSSSGPTRQ